MKFSLYPACLMFRGRLRKNFLAPARTAGDVGHPRTEQETLHCRRPKKSESLLRAQEMRLTESHANRRLGEDEL